MATKTEKNWGLTSYTVDTWTDVLNEPAAVAAIIIANLSVGDAVVQLRLEDGGTHVAQPLPPAIVASNGSITLDVRSLNITGTQALQFQADVAGVEVISSGVA